jgi:hypothetical protein
LVQQALGLQTKTLYAFRRVTGIGRKNLVGQGAKNVITTA